MGSWHCWRSVGMLNGRESVCWAVFHLKHQGSGTLDPGQSVLGKMSWVYCVTFSCWLVSCYLRSFSDCVVTTISAYWKPPKAPIPNAVRFCSSSIGSLLFLRVTWAEVDPTASPSLDRPQLWMSALWKQQSSGVVFASLGAFQQGCFSCLGLEWSAAVKRLSACQSLVANYLSLKAFTHILSLHEQPFPPVADAQ